MNTYFTIWHYLFIFLSLLIFIFGVIGSQKSENKNMRGGIIFSSLLISILLGFLSVVVIDKYTKKAEIFELKNYRILSNESIVYTGFVRNVGNYTIKTVKLEIKLVNHGHVYGHMNGTDFYKPKGFFAFFFTPSDNEKESKPQTVIHTFIVAKDLAPNKVKYFHVSFPYPPYFSGTSQYTKIYAH